MNLGRETEQLEFKESTSELNDAVKDMSAILNKHCEGVLYFGVADNGDVIGMQIGKETKRDISRKIFERIKPQVYPIIEALEYDGKSVIKVEFSGDARPYSCDGRYYKRVSDEHKELTTQELASMIISANYGKWEKLESDISIDELDEATFQSFLSEAIKWKRLPQNHGSTAEVLSKLGFLSDDMTHLNNAGKLLFSKRKPVQLKLAVFATDEKRTFIDINPIDGNIFELIDAAEKYVKEHINWGVEIHGFERSDVPEIPVDALREIIAIPLPTPITTA